MKRSHFAQHHQHLIARAALTQRSQCRHTAEQPLRKQSDHDREQTTHRRDTPAHPAHRTRERHGVAPQLISRGLYASRLLNGRDHLFDFMQGARKARRQMIGQQAKGAMRLWAVPARDTRTRRAHPFVGAMPSKATPTLRMHRAARQTCAAPSFSGNVFGTGKPRLETKLHTGNGPRSASTLRGPSTFVTWASLCRAGWYRKSSFAPF
jgi:hypothetical protein